MNGYKPVKPAFLAPVLCSVAMALVAVGARMLKVLPESLEDPADMEQHA